MTVDNAADDRGEGTPEFDGWKDPEALVTDQPIRERMLDVVYQLRERTPVAAIADRVDCDTETARDYLEWFAEAGIVREHPGRPVRYESNRSYLRWRRVERIRTQYTDEEIVSELETAFGELEGYREQFGVTDPGEVSLLETANADDVAETWETLSDWKTVQKRAELLDAARRDEPLVGGTPSQIDA
jgi:predicted ArsR family transcriptional regulator